MEKARGRTIGAGRIDRAKVEATTEHDTRRHMIEDGLDPENPLAGFRPLSGIAEVRQRIAMSQDAFARALHVPVKTIRNWEQGRSKPDPAARALLAVVAEDPARAFDVIARRIGPISDYLFSGPTCYPEAEGKIPGRPSKEVTDAVAALGRTITKEGDALLKKL